MRKDETVMGHRLKNKLKRHPIEIKRMENEVDAGTPDAYYYTPFNEGWIEHKIIKSLPVKESTKIKIPFRPGQYGWLMERFSKCPGSVGFLVVQIMNTLYIFKNEGIKEEYTREELIGLSTYFEKFSLAKANDIFKVFSNI